MKVKVIREFIDLENNKKLRKVGDVIDVSKERFTTLEKLKFVQKLIGESGKDE